MYGSKLHHYQEKKSLILTCETHRRILYRKPFKKIYYIYETRAGALAGVGLALDPEGNKRVLIQPSSFEKDTLNVTFLDFLAAEVQLIMIFRFSLG